MEARRKVLAHQNDRKSKYKKKRGLRAADSTPSEYNSDEESSDSTPS